MRGFQSVILAFVGAGVVSGYASALEAAKILTG